MKMIKPKINSVLKYHGGKNYLAKHIIPKLPDCEVFVDGCVGAGNIILNIEPSPHRTDYAIDLDKDLIAMWNILKSNGNGVGKFLNWTSYNEINFEAAKTLGLDNTNPKVSDLWASHYIVKNRFSRGGLGKTFAWSERLRGGIPGDVNAWNNFVQIHLPRIIKRIQPISFRNGCVRRFIQGNFIDFNDKAVVYLDPPYVSSSRTIKKVYKMEMKTYDYERTEENELTHQGLIEMIAQSKCIYFLSGYPNVDYDRLFKVYGLTPEIVFSKDIANHSGQNKKKQRRTEVLWRFN
jgi:site-specific DNA-adenine methylase